MTRPDAPAADDPALKAWRVRLWLALAAACLAVFLVLGLAWWRWEPWLEARLGEDSLVVSGAFEIVGAILIAGPLAGVFRAVSALGSDWGQADAQGRVVLRVRDGSRRLHVGLCAGLFVLFTAGFLVLQDDTRLRIACAGAAAFAVVGGYILWTARVVYDETGLIVHRFALGPRRFAWEALRKVSYVEELDHFRLEFTKGRKTTISSSFAGVGAMIALARLFAANNAARDRDAASTQDPAWTA